MSRERIYSKERLGKFIYGIDADQILIQSIDVVSEQVTKDLGIKFGIKDFCGWNSVKAFAMKNLGWNEKRAESYEEWVWTDSDVLRKAPPVLGAKSFTKRLAAFEIPFFVITSRIPRLRDVTVDWFVNDHMPWIQEEQILINDDEFIAGEVFKYTKIREKGVTLHIDDSIRHARLILDNTDSHVILASNYEGVSELSHPRLTKISADGRMPNMRDVYKKLLLDDHFLSVAQY